MFIYIQTESGEFNVFTVGHYSPSGEFIPESDHPTRAKAAERCAWLNGSSNQ